MKFKAKTNVGMLVECIEAITGVVDDGVVNITRDGWEIRAVDPANVAMVSLKLQSSIFDSYDFEPPTVEGKISSTQIKIGVDFANLLGLLKLWGPGMVELELDEKAENMLIMSGCFDYSNSLIDPSALRRVPEIPKMSFPIQVDVEAERFAGAIRAQERVAADDYVFIGVKKGELCVWAEGDQGKLKVALGELSGAKDAYSMCSIDYLRAMCKGIHADTLTLFIGSNYPIQINFDIAHGKGKVSYLLAPRLLPEEEVDR